MVYLPVKRKESLFGHSTGARALQGSHLKVTEPLMLQHVRTKLYMKEGKQVKAFCT